MQLALSLGGICILPNIAATSLIKGTILDTSMRSALSLHDICILPNIVATSLCDLHSPTYSRNFGWIPVKFQLHSGWIPEFQMNSSFVSVSLIAQEILTIGTRNLAY